MKAHHTRREGPKRQKSTPGHKADRCQWTDENPRIRPHYEGVLSQTQQLNNLDHSVIMGKSQTLAYCIDLTIARSIWEGLSLTSSCNNLTLGFIPLTNRVRGPYPKLRAKFFPLQFMAQAWSAWAINRRGKTSICNLPYGPRRRG